MYTYTVVQLGYETPGASSQNGRPIKEITDFGKSKSFKIVARVK
jgi:hypothetical protein